MYKLKYEITEADFMDFNLHHFNNSKSVKKMMIILRLVGPVIFMAAPFVLKRGSDSILIGMFAILSVLWFIFYPKSVEKSAMKKVGKMINEGKNGDLFSERTITIDDEGVSEKTKNTNQTTQWSGVTRVDHSNNSIFIYLSTVQAYIVPKRLFKSEKKFAEFKEYCESKVEK